MVFFEDWLVGDEKKVWFVWLFYLACVVGAWKVFWWILTPILICFRHCCRCRQNLKAKYGRENSENAYAIVTGGSDGIGFELCKQLAGHGFNICIISRS